MGGRWWTVRHTQKSNVSSVVVPFIRNPQQHPHTSSYYCYYYHAAWRSTWVGTHAPIYRHKPYITGISIKIGARFISPTYLPPSLPPSLYPSIVHTDPCILSSRPQRMRSSPRHSSIGPPGSCIQRPRPPPRARMWCVLYRAGGVVNHVFGNGRRVGPDVRSGTHGAHVTIGGRLE